MTSLQAELPQILQLNEDLWSTNLTAFAAFAVVMYDILITMDQEVGYVWKSKWSLGKAIFLLNRWGGLSFVLFEAIRAASWNSSAFYCANVDAPLRATWQIVTTTIVDLMLTMRVRALCGNSRSLTLTLLLLLFISVMCGITGSALNMVDLSEGAPSGFIVSAGCLDSGPAKYEMLGVVLAYGSTTIFHAILFFLTISRIYPLLGKHDVKTPVLTVFVRDGSAYFGLVFVVYAFTMWSSIYFIRTPRAGLALVIQACVPAVVTTACSRLFLNLRGVVAQPSYATTIPAAPQRIQRVAIKGETRGVLPK